MKHSNTKIIHKQCKQCDTQFSVTYVSAGSGSANVARRKYCSDVCKKQYIRENKTKNNVKLKCEICNKVFYRPKCFEAQETCTNKCRGKLHSKRTQKKYGWHNIKCQSRKCDKTFIGNKNSTKKYCNSQCFAEQQNKQVEITCIFCKKVFIGHKNRKVCNRKCQFAAQSAGLIRVYTNGRIGYRKDLNDGHYYKSSFEADYARYLNYLNKKFKYEPTTFFVSSGLYERHYTPDFYVIANKQYLELKGIKNINNSFAKMMNENITAVKILDKQDNSINIQVLYMVDFYDSLKKQNIFNTIKNLEYRDYNGTRHLIRKR